MHKVMSDKITIALLVVPALIVFCFAVIYPVFLSFYYGLTDWTGMGEYNFIGFTNYYNIIFKDPIFWRSLSNALLLACLTVFIQHPIALFFAYLVSKSGGKFEKIFRAIYFVPCVISIVVTSKMWVSIYNSQYGLLNKVLTMLNLTGLKREWLSDPKIAMLSVIIIIMWQGFGWAMLIYYAGIKGLPKDVYEAAKVDGATNSKLLFSISIPLLWPVIVVNITLAVISSLKQMETVFLTTRGGPGGLTQLLGNYLYVQAFDSYKYGYGNAISGLFVIFCIIITVVLNKVLKREAI